MSDNPTHVLLLFCQISLGLVFLISAIAKVRDIRLFEQTITDFQITPSSTSYLVARTILIGEIGVCVMMVVGNGTLVWGFILSFVLLSIFAGLLIYTLIHKSNIRCNCFGESNNIVSWYDVGRNAVLILWASIGIVLAILEPNVHISISSLDIILIGIIAVTMLVLTLYLKELLFGLRVSTIREK